MSELDAIAATQGVNFNDPSSDSLFSLPENMCIKKETYWKQSETLTAMCLTLLQPPTQLCVAYGFDFQPCGELSSNTCTDCRINLYTWYKENTYFLFRVVWLLLYFTTDLSPSRFCIQQIFTTDTCVQPLCLLKCSCFSSLKQDLYILTYYNNNKSMSTAEVWGPGCIAKRCQFKVLLESFFPLQTSAKT